MPAGALQPWLASSKMPDLTSHSDILIGSPKLPHSSPGSALRLTSLIPSSFLCCSFSSKPPGVTGAGLVGPERGALEIGEEEGSWIMDPEKLWEAQGLWQQSWVLGLRTRLTSPGLELRFTALFLEGDSHTVQGLPGFLRSHVLLPALNLKKNYSLTSRNIA